MRLVFGAKTGGLEQTAGRRCWHLDGPAARPRRGERRPRSIGFTLPLNRQFLHRNQHHPSYARDVDDTCTILLCVNGMVGPDDKRSSNDILIDTVRRAALKRSFLALPANVRRDLAENADYLA